MDADGAATLPGFQRPSHMNAMCSCYYRAGWDVGAAVSCLCSLLLLGQKTWARGSIPVSGCGTFPESLHGFPNPRLWSSRRELGRGHAEGPCQSWSTRGKTRVPNNLRTWPSLAVQVLWTSLTETHVERALCGSTREGFSVFAAFANCRQLLLSTSVNYWAGTLDLLLHFHPEPLPAS